TIALATPRLPRAQDLEVVSMIRSTFSAKSLAGADSAAEFSRRSSGALAHARKIANADLICVTTCRSNSKKRLLAPKKRLKSRSSIPAADVMAVGLRRDRARFTVPPAAAAVRGSVRADFFRFHKPVLDVAAPAKSSRSRVRSAVGRDAWKK